MSWETSKRVWENVPPSVTKNERLALLALAERSDKYGVCWPGYEDIGRLVGVDPRSAMRLIEKLEKGNQVIVLRQMGMRGGRGYTNLYFVITGLSAQEAKVITQNHPILKEKGDKIYTLIYTKLGDSLDTLNQEKGDNFNEKGDKNQLKGDKLSPEPIEPSSIEPNIKTPPKIFKQGIEPEVLGPLAKSILEACCLDFKMMSRATEREFDDTFEKFKRKKATAVEVAGFRQWWDDNDWRGRKGQPPTLIQLYENWKLFKSFKPGASPGKERTNGRNHPTTSDAIRDPGAKPASFRGQNQDAGRNPDGFSERRRAGVLAGRQSGGET